EIHALFCDCLSLLAAPRLDVSIVFAKSLLLLLRKYLDERFLANLSPLRSLGTSAAASPKNGNT
ncbi:unnamed protein product, partial [Amoebophrya sp. A25]